MANKYAARAASLLQDLGSLTEGVKERMSKLSTKGIRSMAWYKEDTRAQLAGVEAEQRPHMYSHFGFCRSQTANQVEICRENFCTQLAPRFREGKSVWFYLDIIGRSPESIARMRRKTHILEKNLGYRLHKMTCVRRYHRPKVGKQAKEMHGSRWRVQASPTWRRSIPMFSFFLGALRSYCRNQGTPSKRLMYKILDKNSVGKLFGKKGSDLQKNWANSGTRGAKYYEDRVRRSPHLKKKLGV